MGHVYLFKSCAKSDLSSELSYFAIVDKDERVVVLVWMIRSLRRVHALRKLDVAVSCDAYLKLLAHFFGQAAPRGDANDRDKSGR